MEKDGLQSMNFDIEQHLYNNMYVYTIITLVANGCFLAPNFFPNNCPLPCSDPVVDKGYLLLSDHIGWVKGHRLMLTHIPFLYHIHVNVIDEQ